MINMGHNILHVLNIGLTVLIGILTLASESIGKVDYIFMWLMLLLHEAAVLYAMDK